MNPKSFKFAFAAVFASVASAAVAGIAQEARAAGEASGGGAACIDEKAKQSLSSCPNGPSELKSGGSNKTGVSFKSVAPLAGAKKDNKPGKPDIEQGAAQRDERTSKLKARQKQLLITEIQGIESLFQGTPKNAPDRPQLARRLAESYVELEAAAFRDKTNAEVKRDELKKKNPQAAGQQQTQVNASDQVAKNARKNAIKYYTLVVKDYPNYPALDEVLYYLAYEYEQAGDNKNARRVYLDLINSRPKSKYIPNAYLAFGELFFNEAQGDPSKWDLAAQAYKEVIKYPPETNKVYGYAWYKLGYVHWNKGEAPEALNAFKKTIDYGTQYSQLPGATKLADTARRDIVPVYAMQGNPLAAYNFFHPLSGDSGSANTKTFQMMDDLGLNYIDTGHYPEAIALYEDLEKRDKAGDKFCTYQVHITESSMAMKSGDKAFIRTKLTDQLKVHNEFVKSGKPEKAKFECANKTAALMTETAMAWHLEAAGPQNQKGTNDPKTMTAAAGVYKEVVDTWKADDFAKFEFPRLVKADWPTIYRLKYNMADLLYFQEKWAECGPAFDSVVEENPKGPDAAEAAFASVLCYQKIYEQTHSKEKERATLDARASNAAKKSKVDQAKADKAAESAKLQPKEYTDNQKGMIGAFNRYVCYVKPADDKAKEQMCEVKYARSRTHLEAFHWEEAAVGFKDVANTCSGKEVGLLAAQYYLEAVNVVGEHYSPPRPSCFDEMAGEVPKFIELYCKGADATKNAEDCERLNKVQADILAKKGEKLVELADTQTGTQALVNYEKGAQAYGEVFDTYCKKPVEAKQKPQSEKCDKVAYNSARAYQAARLIAKAIQMREGLIRFDADACPKGCKSDLAKKAIYEIGGNYQAIAVYEKAAEYYERYAAADQTGEGADQALQDATVLRLGLGQEDEAIKDAANFRKYYGAKKPAQTAAIAYAVGAHYADKENWEQARTTLRGASSVLSKAAPDIQVQAQATLGRAAAKTKGGEREAAGAYAKVRALWGSGDDAMAKMKAAYPNDDEGSLNRRLGKALTAVGEAYFFSAERMKEEKVDPVRFPEYRGPGSKDTVLKHINTKVKDWLEKKRDAITKVEAEYKKIVDLKPEPPPRWVIAAGSRVGLMWGNFVDEFRSAPIPKEWKTDADLRGTYYDALDGASEPIKSGKAKPALVTCLNYSVKFQYFDDYSRNCEVWLAKNYKAEYHVVDELRGSPTLANNALDEKSPPLLLGGQFFREQTGGPDKPKDAAAGTEKAEDKNAAKKPAKKK